MIHVQEGVPVILFLAVLWSHVFTRIFLTEGYKMKIKTGLMAHWLERVIHRIHSNWTVHMKVTNKMANSNALQECVCVLLIFNAELHTDVCVSECIHLGGSLERAHIHTHTHTYTNTSPKERGATPLVYHSSDGIGWKGLCIRSKWLAANWVTVLSSYYTQWKGQQGQLRLALVQFNQTSLKPKVQSHCTAGYAQREREMMKVCWLQLVCL